jgi:hypothetical protein
MIDPIDELLTPRPDAPAPAGDRVWEATRAAVARRRWLRRAGIGLAFATCCAAGVATSDLFRPRPAMAQRMLQALDAPLPKFDAAIRNMPLKDVVARVRKLAPDVPIMAQLVNVGDQTVTIDFEGAVTLGGLFQMLGDAVPDLHVYVRDYGFLVTVDNAPTDGMRIAEFQATANKNR